MRESVTLIRSERPALGLRSAVVPLETKPQMLRMTYAFVGGFLIWKGLLWTKQRTQKSRLTTSGIYFYYHLAQSNQEWMAAPYLDEAGEFFCRNIYLKTTIDDGHVPSCNDVLCRHHFTVKYVESFGKHEISDRRMDYANNSCLAHV